MTIPLALHGTLAFLALASSGSADSTVHPPKLVRQLGPPVDATGAPVRRADGTRILYTQVEASARTPQAQAPRASSETAGGPPSFLGSGAPTVIHSFASFGQGIGLSGISTANVNGRTEIYCGGSGSTFGGNSYWYALARNAATANYDMVYVSPLYASGVVRLEAADVRSESGPEIVVLHTDSTIDVLSAETKQVLASFTCPVASPAGMRFHDLNGDGLQDIFVVGPSSVAAIDGSGTVLWTKSGVGGQDIAIGQMDSDPSLEVATTDGNVVDVATGTIQCTWAPGFGFRLALSDFDGDGMQELIFAEAWGFVWAFDVDTCLPKWSLPVFNVGAMAVADVDGDGTDELIIGDAQWGNVHAHSLTTQQQLWTIPNPQHGTTWVAIADVDGTPGKEVMWGAGATSTGPDRIYVADPVAQAIEWQNIQLEGPFVGPRLGDVDGDGKPDIVTVSNSSDAGYGAGRIVVFDAETLAVKAISQPTMQNLGWTGIGDLVLVNVDADRKLEIAIAAETTYDGLIEIYDYAPSGPFPRIWSNQTLPFGAPFTSLAIGDTDGDGVPEVVGGVGAAHSGAVGIFTYVYDLATGAEKWHTLQMGATWSPVRNIALADTDGDGKVEIHAMVQDGTYVFDGPTHTLQAILGSQLRCMDVLQTPGLPTIWTGDASGRLASYRWDGSHYIQYGPLQIVSAGPLEAFTFGRGSSIYAASEGSLDFRRRLRDPNPQWTLDGWGTAFGNHVVRVKSVPMLVTSNAFGVFGFREP
jgi:hypothetical protein